MKTIFTSESVGEGHPDKVADLISDMILDECLKQDKDSRVACETLVKDNIVVVGGEISNKAAINVESIVLKAMAKIGYILDTDDPVFNMNNVKVINLLSKQSPDIARGVDAHAAEGKEGSEQGAGDQGIMFGYATNETEEMMPLPISLAHKIVKELARRRHNDGVRWLKPDCKSQVSVEYEDGKPRIASVLISTQHDEEVDNETIREFCKNVAISVLPKNMVDDNTNFYVNPTGRFVVGGPHGDCGLTGRKIIVDTYGGMGRHGGGAFSGKDATKVDRSGAYMCRWVAKHVVAAGLADKCEIEVSYAIGRAEPLSIHVETFGTAHGVNEEDIANQIRHCFSFKPADIIRELDLKNPIYSTTTNYGHFGKLWLPWERLRQEAVDCLKTLLTERQG